MGSPEAIEAVGRIVAGLRGMVGMDKVADQLEAILAETVENEARVKEGLKPIGSPFHHILMIGPPGTGKSTVAKEIAEALSLIGVTNSNRMATVLPTDLKGAYVAEAAEKTAAKLKELDGGVLLVDEAHQFNDDDFARNSLRAMIQPMADPNYKGVIIFAGYPEEMKGLMQVDPGLRSRFPHRLDFERYDADDMIDIAFDMLHAKDQDNADKKAEREMERVITVVAEDPNHASGRTLDSLIKWANENRRRRNKRNAKMPLKQRGYLTAADWKAAESELLRQRVGV